jgi:anthranilate/para-aminobenzoate synthase component I
VKVPCLVELERFATVFHLTSTVEARLRPDRDLVDLCSPPSQCGSITGAPKIRAMEIIDDGADGLWHHTGAIGYIHLMEGWT